MCREIGASGFIEHVAAAMAAQGLQRIAAPCV
jgi:hypothetical protein